MVSGFLFKWPLEKVAIAFHVTDVKYLKDEEFVTDKDLILMWQV